MAKDTQIYGSVELRDESKTSEYGTFTRSERKTNHGRNSTVGLKIPQTRSERHVVFNSYCRREHIQTSDWTLCERRRTKTRGLWVTAFL